MRKLIKFIKDLYKDYKNFNAFGKPYARRCYKRIVGHLFSYLWSIISAPFLYPIWYSLRKYPKFIPDWLYTYGDANDPLGRGGMPEDYRNGKNNFFNRFMYSAIRNPRFNYNYENYKTGVITFEATVIDTRNYDTMHKSYGVGDMPDGVVFKWFIDENQELYFIYENITKESSFWFGYVSLLNGSIGDRGRFEVAFRVNKKK